MLYDSFSLQEARAGGCQQRAKHASQKRKSRHEPAREDGLAAALCAAANKRSSERGDPGKP